MSRVPCPEILNESASPLHLTSRVDETRTEEISGLRRALFDYESQTQEQQHQILQDRLRVLALSRELCASSGMFSVMVRFSGEVPIDCDITHRNASTIGIHGKPDITFTRVFSYLEPTEQVANSIAYPLLSSLLNYDNSSVALLFDGQSGGGKTYTMHKANDGNVMRIVSAELFQQLHSAGTRFSISCTAMEVFLNKPHDIFAPKTPPPEPVKSLNRLHNKTCSSAQECLNLLATAYNNLNFRPTNANQSSSRGHFVFSIHIHLEGKDEPKIFLVIDLAGREDAESLEKCDPDRLEEKKANNDARTQLYSVLKYKSGAITNRIGVDSKAVLVQLLQPSLISASKVVVCMCTKVQQPAASSGKGEGGAKLTNNHALKMAKADLEHAYELMSGKQRKVGQSRAPRA